MTIPFKPGPADDFDRPHRLHPVDEKVSSILGFVLIIFAGLLLAADLSAVIVPRMHHHHIVNPVAVEKHREIDWQKTQ